MESNERYWSFSHVYEHAITTQSRNSIKEKMI